MLMICQASKNWSQENHDDRGNTDAEAPVGQIVDVADPALCGKFVEPDRNQR